MQERHKLPATLVVVCPERRVAQWLASLSAIVHSADLDHHVIMRALSTAMRTRTPSTDMRIWTELVERGLGRSPAAEQWRRLMAVDLSFFQSKTSQQLRREGAIDDAARNIVIILRERGVEASDSDRERILSCKDEELLRVWLKRAALAASVDELWDAPEALQPASSAG